LFRRDQRRRDVVRSGRTVAVRAMPASITLIQTRIRE
jgi:hypothetical protein